MTALFAAVAVLAFADAGRRLARRVVPRSTLGQRAALCLVLGAALLCSAYGVLGEISTSHPADIELVFHGDAIAAPRDSTTQGAGEVRVFESIVDAPRATPRNLAFIALGCALVMTFVDRKTRARSCSWTRYHLAYVPIALSGLAALRSVARGYDALWYHLPMAVAFARNAHLEPPGRDLISYFPADTELLARTLLDLFGARALPLVQLPFAIALGPLVATIARRIGGAPMIAMALLLGCPIVVFQAGLAYVDVVSLASLAAALLVLLDGDDVLHSLCAGLCLGLALGSKYAALPLVASGAPVIAVFLALRSRKLPIGSLLAIALGIALPAWFWYVRNLRLTGNPLYPIAIPALHLRGLFTPRSFNAMKELELVGTRAEWWIHPWVAQLTHETGFGAAFATLVPLSVVPLVALLARRARRALFLPVAWGLVYLAMWWFGTPHEVRHLLPLVVLLGAPATILARVPGMRRVVDAALVVGVLVLVRIQLFSPSPDESARAHDFESFYGIPPDVLDALPANAHVANAAGRPYNFALLGPHLTLRTTEYMDVSPTAHDLDDLHAEFVFARGSPSAVEAIRQRADSLARPLVVRWQTTLVQSASRWTFWGASAADTLILFERTRAAAESWR